MKIESKICIFAATMLALTVQTIPAIASQAAKQAKPVVPQEVIAPTFSRQTSKRQAVFVEFESRELGRSGTLIGDDLVVAPYHAVRKADGSEQVTIRHETGVIYGRVFGGNEDLDVAYISAPSLKMGSLVKMAQTMPQTGEPVNFVFRNAVGVTSVPGTYGGQQQNLGKINLTRPITTGQYGGVVYDACGYFLGTVGATESFRNARKDKPVAQNLTFVTSQRLRVTDGFGVKLAPRACPTRAAVIAQSQRIAAAKQQAEQDKIKAAEDKRKADAAKAKAKAKAEEDAKRAADAKAQEAKNAKLRRSEAEAKKRAKEAEEKAQQAANETEAEKKAREEAEKKAKEKEDALKVTEKEKDDAVATAEEKKKQTYIIAGAAGGGILLLGLLSLLLISKQKKARAAAEKDASHQRDYAENLKSHIPPNPYSDCLLYGSESLKLLGAQLPEAAGGVIVGRHPAQAQVVLDSVDVSRNHARFYVRNNEVYLEDLGSTNGTFVNTRRLTDGEKYVIQTGDYIKLGEHEFEFRKLDT